MENSNLDIWVTGFIQLVKNEKKQWHMINRKGQTMNGKDFPFVKSNLWVLLYQLTGAQKYELLSTMHSVG